ncbi:MAG: amidase [Myxococcales bacterium]|nr:amidase [Myxococcales bacterium]
MRMPEYDDLDATALAELVARNKVSPAELLDACLDRIDARNPAINAIVERLEGRARERLDRLPDGPLRGVPFLFKDLKLQLAGTVTTNGNRLNVGRVAERSSVLAERYEAAGLQIVGKSNTSEFGIMGTCETDLRGPCRNPWDLDHTAGGSSGGSGAAVAARIVPAAHGGDGGGSIRIPAAHCGLFGLKPTRGRVTMAPFAGEAWGGFVQEHVLTRSVRDSALLLDIADPPTPGEPYAAPPKARPWVDELAADPGRLRVAYTTEPLYAGEKHPDTTAAVLETVKLLEDMGHEVVEARPTFDRAAMVRAYFLTVGTGAAWFCRETARAAGRPLRARDFESATWLLALIGEKAAAPDLLTAQIAMQRMARDVAAFFERHDVFVTPTNARPPARIGELVLSTAEEIQVGLIKALPLRRILDVALEQMGGGKLAYTPNTQLFNQTGQPAMSVPLHWNPQGLPIGVQFAARFGDEATLFRLAARLEEARPWAGRRPPAID